MKINKEIFEKRREELLKGLEIKRAEVNAFVGAIQDCEYWLSQCKEEETVDGSTSTDQD